MHKRISKTVAFFARQHWQQLVAYGLASWALVGAQVVLAADDHFVSVGSYQELRGAERASASAATQLNISHQVLSAETDSGVFYRVVSGPYLDRAVAREAAAQAKAAGFAGAWILSVSGASVVSTQAPAAAVSAPAVGSGAASSQLADAYPSSSASSYNSSDYDSLPPLPPLPPLDPLPVRDTSTLEQRAPREPLPQLVEEAPASFNLHKLHRPQ